MKNRVFIVFKSLNNKINIKEQEIEPLIERALQPQMGQD